ncbi:MAG: Hpt domain-containing protein [Desulfamplus sp.]|nr:Hpt domain-containing protein [Desulfamplus sp.]
MDANLEHYKREFFQELREIVENTLDSILKLESDPENQNLINSIFRGIHTIKGSAGVFELHELSGFTHHLEGLLNYLRDGKVSLTPDMTDAILAGVDHIGKMAEAYENGSTLAPDAELEERFCFFYNPPDDSTKDCGSVAKSDLAQSSVSGELSNKLGGQLNGESDGELAYPPAKIILNGEADKLPEHVVKSLEEFASQGLTLCRIELLYTSDLLENGYDPAIFLKNLRRICKLYYPVTDFKQIPAIQEFEPLALYLKPVIYVASKHSISEIADLSFDETLIDIVDLRDLSASGASDGTKSIVDMKEALHEFITGATEMVESAEQASIEYEQKGTIGSLNEIFRVVHNIKGDADFMGFKDLTTFAHTFETLLDKLRGNRIARSASVVDIILKSLDYIKIALRLLSEGKPLPPLPPIYNEITQYEQSKKGAKYQTQGDLDTNLQLDISKEIQDVYVEQLYQYRRMLSAVLDYDNIPRAKYSNIGRALEGLRKASNVVDHSLLNDLSTQALALFNNPSSDDFKDALPTNRKADITFGKTSPLKMLIIQIITSINDLNSEPKRIGEILVAEGKIAPEELDKALELQKPIGQILVESGKVSESDVAQALKKQDLIETARQKLEIAEQQTQGRTEDGGEATIRTMRVDERKIEQFTNTVGEMLIARNTYAYLIDQLEHSKGDPHETIKSLKENLHLFSRLSNDIHHGVISLRMIPVRGIFQKFTRVVRDISRKQKKMIDLLTDGEDIEIDKKVADMLSDPMVHLIRNSCDHGIEPPLERKRAGKSEKGTLLLRASREGSNIVIRIIDDGRGVNRERLFQKALSNGIAVASVDDPALLNMIFLPGLSTAAEITDVSGRGVGMDVVKTTVESLGGHVRVASEIGQGTEITLSIPTALGIDTVLSVEVDSQSYAIPIGYIVETIRIPIDKFRNAGSTMVFYYRGEVLSAHYLVELLDGNGGNGQGSCAQKEQLFLSEQAEEISVVIIQTSRGKRGIIIDKLHKNMEIAVRPVPDVLSEIDIIAGVSIMGDGKVLLVLNPERMV